MPNKLPAVHLLSAALALSLSACAHKPQPLPPVQPVQVPPPAAQLMKRPPPSQTYSDNARALMERWQKRLESLQTK